MRSVYFARCTASETIKLAAAHSNSACGNAGPQTAAISNWAAPDMLATAMLAAPPVPPCAHHNTLLSPAPPCEQCPASALNDGSGCRGDHLFAAHTRCEFLNAQALLGHVQHAEIGDDPVNHALAGQR
ncbi:MAG: hypothetical protein ACI8W7_003037 [Gammaproteobacteria bacterium]|jgi:hypothetical protein